MGTCFGSYIVIHTHVFGGDLMRGGVSIHPGHPTQMATEGEDEGALYSHITAPQYFMATPDSSNHVRPGGLADQIIKTVGTRVATKISKIWGKALKRNYYRSRNYVNHPSH